MVASLALGTMNFGKRTPEPEAARLIAYALHCGVTVFDTANVYANGESERILGRALGPHRHAVTIATKAGLDRGEGLSPAALTRAVDGSLGRLHVDTIDLFYLHAPDAKTPLESTLDGVAALFAAGKIRRLGVSNYAAWQILEIGQLLAERSLPALGASQVLYNLLLRELEIEYLPFAKQHGLHTTVFNPLAGGLLVGAHAEGQAPPAGSRFATNALYRGRYWTTRMFKRVQSLKELAREEGMSLLQLAYAWLAQRPQVDSILVGPATLGHFDDARAALGKTVSAEGLQKIDALHLDERGSDTYYVR